MAKVILKPNKEFRVGKFVCVGQNYDKHIAEMSAERTSDPVLFLKPSTSVVNEGSPIKLPPFSNEVHHEIELALLVSKKAKSIKSDDWKNYIAGVGIALDLTMRDHQAVAKTKGLPWSVSKGFDGACPIGTFIPLNAVNNIEELKILLYVNGEIRQEGNTNQMIFSPEKLFEYISSIFTLEPGDIILTGTPSGVGPLQSGDEIKGIIENIGEINFKVSH
jgi:2-keto-4-pentenoate hydratase/2-oxohepta-3-ene-1,7-dioic acid hydratase in catechol pathway